MRFPYPYPLDAALRQITIALFAGRQIALGVSRGARFDGSRGFQPHGRRGRYPQLISGQPRGYRDSSTMLRNTSFAVS